MTHPRTSSTHPLKVHRNLTAFSCAPEEDRRRDGLLRSAWNLITDGFSCKPEPKTAWYETATGDSTPWKKVVTPIRAAIVAAHMSGDEQLLAQTIEGANAFCDELKADFASLVPTTDQGSIVQDALAETHMQGPADEASMALVHNSACPIAAERAIAPLARHLTTLVRLIEHCRRAARQQPQLRQVR